MIRKDVHRNFHVELLSQSRLGLADIEAIARLKMTAWPYDLASQIDWLKRKTEPNDKHVVAKSGRSIVGYLRITNRGIVGASSPKVVGISTVVTLPDVRLSGVGRTIMAVARREIETDKDWVVGMLCCADDKRGFYEKCGWRKIDILVAEADDPARKFFRDRNVMILGEHKLPAIVQMRGPTF